MCKGVNKIKDNDKPFGGVQTILVGDFCQLSPVKGDYCFQCDTWRKLNLEYIYLTEIVRQKDDEELKQILQEVRFANCSSTTINKLTKLQNNVLNEDIKPAKLFALRADVDAVNKIAFEKLYLSTHKKFCEDARKISCNPIIMHTEYDIELLTATDYNSEKDIFRYNAYTNDKKTDTKEYIVELFQGLQVMVTRNINFDKGLINGTIGIICNLTPTSVCIKSNKIYHMIYYHKDINENNNTYVKFMPLKLAYAISIHKSQGATLDAVEIDASSLIFAQGQLYTALSRARSIENIKLINFDKDSIMCNADVKEFYENLKCTQKE
jgi:ATP-dependent DNA helicase PIF1